MSCKSKANAVPKSPYLDAVSGFRRQRQPDTIALVVRGLAHPREVLHRLLPFRNLLGVVRLVGSTQNLSYD
jgi:hypothetical protein